ncbi:hypothetical protein ACFLRZ_00545 [Bacteroidota bacterium]
MKEKSNHIDHTLRSIVKDFEKAPPQKTWKGIAKKMFLKDLLSFNLKNVQFRLYSAILIILFLCSIIFWGLNSQNHKELTTNKKDPEKIKQEQSLIIVEEKRISEIQGNQSFEKPLSESNNISESNKSVINNLKNTNINHKKSFVNPAKERNEINLLNVPDVKESHIDHSSSQVIKENINDLSFPSGIKKFIGTISINNVTNAISGKPSGYNFSDNKRKEISGINFKKPLSYALGIYLGRDGASNNYVSEKYLQGNLFNIFFELQRTSWFFRTGLGTTEVVSKYGYTQTYSKYEPLGSYYKLDSVGAKVYTDSILNKTVFDLHYYTTLVTLQDTLDYSIINEYTTHYTYLNIPVFIGYKKHFSRFGFYLSAGPVLSFLMNTKEEDIKTIDENPGEISYQDKDAVKFFWQLQLFAGLEYYINSDISLAIEPICKFMDNTFINKSGYAENQMVFGIRYGLIWHIR